MNYMWLGKDRVSECGSGTIHRRSITRNRMSYVNIYRVMKRIKYQIYDYLRINVAINELRKHVE